ncbi:hypothetical protein BXZ70DRAFT_613497 [Cristinia sonorae]|uniref:Uncharacterized protein n=1 Tax=Cristinia sonorae TaxID=1940300 RepID=A0A8K0UUL2_9AGAR|nr:hypothetical protein BXZ70DRAFT_613497 [Cristinia sonorae]
MPTMHSPVIRASRPLRAAQCCCGRAFKPEKDMENYCSQQCARDDTLRALMGEENSYRQKVQTRKAQKENAGRPRPERLAPRLFPSSQSTSSSKVPPYQPPALYTTKENLKPTRVAPSAPRPVISSPFTLAARGPPLSASTSRLHLPAIGGLAYSSPRPAPAKKPSQNILKSCQLPSFTWKPNKKVRRSASESQLKATIQIMHHQAPELKDPPLTYYLQSPSAAVEIRTQPSRTVHAPRPLPSPTHVQPHITARSPHLLQVPNERHHRDLLRRSKSFSPYKPFVPTNVPEDVNQYSYRISGDV